MRGNRYAFLLSFTSILRAIGQHAKAVLEYQECTAHTRHIHTHPTRHQTSKRKKKVTKKRTTIYPNKLNYRRTTRQNKTAEAAKGVRRRQVVPSASLFFSLIFSACRLLSFLLVVCFLFCLSSAFGFARGGEKCVVVVYIVGLGRNTATVAIA